MTPLLAALLALSAAPAPIQVTLRPAATVSAPIVRLRDIAEVRCADAKLAASAADVDLGAAPAIGYTRSVSADYTRYRLSALGIRGERLRLLGPANAQVTRASQILTGAAQEQAAREAAEALAPGTVAQSFAPLRERTIPQGAVTLRATQSRLASDASSATVTLEIGVDGRTETTLTVGMRLLRRAPVVVAAHGLPAGTLLTEDDLHVEERPVVSGVSLLTEVAQAVGRQVTVSVAAGAPLPANALRTVPVVRRGARVKTLCRGTGFAIVCAAEALEDGAVGQTIRVRNADSRKEFTARVLDAQTLEVVF